MSHLPSQHVDLMTEGWIIKQLLTNKARTEVTVQQYARVS